jgi:fucose permease
MSTTLSVHRPARLAVFVMFFVNGSLFANWVSRIPDIQRALALTPGELGIVLLGIAVGVLTALGFVGGLIARFGSQRVTMTAMLAMCVLLTLLAWMPSAPLLFINLALFGASMSTMDIAMNAQAVEVERRYQQPIMSSFHALFSLGGVVGALVGALLISLGMSPAQHFLGAAFTYGLLAFAFSGSLLRIEKEGRKGAPVFQLPRRELLPFGVVAFCAALGEGSMADWSGVYLESVIGADASIAALGFAAFSLTMTVGRFTGDWLVARFRRDLLVQLGGGLAGVGLLLAVFIPSVPTALLGFAAVGAGISITIPLVFSAAGNLPNIPPGVGIAGVSTIGYGGFLAGPPLIGLVAEATSLQVSMLIVAVLIASLVYSGRVLRMSHED